MKNTLSIASSLLILFLLQIAVSAVKPAIYHPFWFDKANLIGAGIGLAIVIHLFVLEKFKPSIFKALGFLIFVGMFISLGITWYYASIFVNSANFEALAGKYWYVSYHVFVALLLPVVAVTIKKLLPLGKA